MDYYLLATTFVAVATLGLVHFGRLYALDALMHPFAYVDRIILALGSALLLLLATLYSLHAADDFSYEWATAFAGGSIGGVVGCRIVIQRILKQLSDHDVIKRNIAIVGTGRQARALIAQLRDNPPDFTSFVGVFEDAAPGERAVEGAHVLGGLQDLSNSVRRNLIDDVIIALPWSEDDKVASLVEELSVFPVSIHLAADLVGFRLGLARIPGFSEGAHGLFANSPILELSRRPLSGWGIVAKSALDYVLGTALLIALLPVFALVAAAVKLDSAGPVFYRQKRLGFNNEEFDIYKFRSMRIETGDTARTVQATRDDPRVTRVGRFIRRTSIDELPQILNVLNGTMSLVGPRPHAMDHNEEYSTENPRLLCAAPRQAWYHRLGAGEWVAWRDAAYFEPDGGASSVRCLLHRELEHSLRPQNIALDRGLRSLWEERLLRSEPTPDGAPQSRPQAIKNKVEP